MRTEASDTEEEDAQQAKKLQKNAPPKKAILFFRGDVHGIYGLQAAAFIQLVLSKNKKIGTR